MNRPVDPPHDLKKTIQFKLKRMHSLKLAICAVKFFDKISEHSSNRLFCQISQTVAILQNPIVLNVQLIHLS
jgi:hypothetical protein